MTKGSNKDIEPGLKGWLILVGLGVVIMPFKIFFESYAIFQPIFADGAWSILTTPGNDAYNPLWKPVLIFEIAYNTVMVIIALGLNYLFFTKHWMFPKAYCVVLISFIIFLLVDSALVTLVLPEEPMFDPETVKELVRSTMIAGIWVPYMFMSKRVKITFVKNRNLNFDEISRL